MWKVGKIQDMKLAQASQQPASTYISWSTHSPEFVDGTHTPELGHLSLFSIFPFCLMWKRIV